MGEEIKINDVNNMEYEIKFERKEISDENKAENYSVNSNKISKKIISNNY